MANIAVLVPRVEIMEQANLAAQNMNVKLFLNRVIETHEAVQAARSAVAEGANIIIARGLQAALIKKETNIPLVEIRLTGQELGLLVKRAIKLSKKEKPHIGVVGFNNTYSSMEHFEDLYDIRLSTYFIKEMDEVRDVVLKAIEEKVDIIIGGDQSAAIAERHGIPSIFSEATEESITYALQIAEKAAYAIDMEKQSAAHLDTILETSLDGIIRIDQELRIRSTNRVVRDGFSIKEIDLQGKLITDLFPDISTDYVARVLRGEEAQLSTSVQFQNSQLMVTVTPIQFEGNISGCIIALHKMGGISPQITSRLHDMYLSGFVANGSFEYISRSSKEINRAIELAKMYALSRSPILIYGEAGTEKELFAQSIHNSSSRRNQPYVSVNCFGDSEEKQGALLFGAQDDEGQSGAIVAANFGTIHIADIQNLTPQCQYRLFKLINQKVLIRNDINKAMNIDVRIIASSDKDLAILVKKERFRKDLYYAIQALVLNLPPLHNNVNDIEQLFLSFFKKYMELYSKYIVISDGAMEKVKSYTWDGNLLQLDRFCEVLVLTSKKRTLDEGYVGNLLMELYPVVEDKEEKVTVYKHPEALKLSSMLEKHGGNRKAVAKEMGISTTTLWRHIKKYGIEEQYR